MDLADPRERAMVRRRIGDMFSGRKVILGVAPLAGLTDLVALVRSCGSETPLVVATGRGAGSVPPDGDAQVVFVDAPTAPTVTEELRQHDGLLRGLPAHARAAVEEYDPHGEALWVVGPFIASEPILSRPVVGGRPHAWSALEDKLVVDEIWRAVGHPHAASLVVRLDPEEIRRAGSGLDEGMGVVWAGDARDGFNGGGDFVRWVRDDDDAAAAYAFLGPRCDRVRVMPFLEGVPCSIHGLVLADGTASFRPVELAILRSPDGRFVYGGQGTTWNPPEEDREQMRDLARSTGEHLRRRVGYRGFFGIDGVLTRDGFRPTELNPRMSGGVGALARAVDVSLFHILQLSLSSGHDVPVGASDLEAWALPAMDTRPFTRAIAISRRRVVETARDFPVAWEGDRLVRRTVDAPFTASVAPTAVGTFAKLEVHDLPERAPRTASLNVALMNLLDDVLGTGFGEVRAAPDLRCAGAV